MEKKKVLVTGAGGYIGRHVVNALLELGQDVYAADFSPRGIDERATYVSEPIFSHEPDIYERLGKPDVCIHLAWKDGFVHNSRAHMEQLSNHITFLNDMIDGGLPSLSVMGTMHEVGYWEGAITADSPCNPLSQYGIAKNALRQSLLLYAKDKQTAVHWLRAYYITGDDARGNSIFAKITKAAQEGKKEFPFTSGKNLYDFIDVDELARQIAVASLQTEYTGAINCCTGNPRSLADRVEDYIKEHNFDIKLNYGAFPDRPYDSPGTWGDAEIIQKIMSKYGEE